MVLQFLREIGLGGQDWLFRDGIESVPGGGTHAETRKRRDS